MKNYLCLSFLLIIGWGCNPTATPETDAERLLQRLYQLREKGILLGHQDDLAYGHAWYGEPGRSDVKDMTGDYPALIGLELGHIELGAEYNLDSVYFSDMKRFVRETHLRDGICSFSWHADNIATGLSSWDCAQDTVVRSVLPGGVHHAEYLAWLDCLAAFFSDLKDENGNFIPVIFRMYHEHTGDWFWWGSRQCTPEEYKALWKMTFQYLKEEKQLQHMVYAYSSSNAQSEEHYLERYPGDEYVDIVGFDHYLKGGDTTETIEKYRIDFERNLQIVCNYAKRANKLPVVGETGMESIPNTTYFTEILYPMLREYPVGSVLFWRNAWDKPKHHYLPYPCHPSENDFKSFVSKPEILLNQEILNL